LKTFRSDLEEFNNILGIAKGRAEKEAILMEINVLLGKIESLKAQTYNW
jgi:hypothetical protein